MVISGSLLTNAQDITNNKFGKGLYNVVAKDSSYSMNFAARFQNLFIGEFDLNDSLGVNNATSNFLVRRARLKFGGFVYTTKLNYKVELGLTNGDISNIGPETKNAPGIVFDAVIKWNFYKNLTLWVGQTKLPGNRERVVSSGNLQFVDRSLVNSNFNIDRDMGAQLRHHFKLGEKFTVREIISVSQGEGRNITVGNLGGYDWTGRIEILPFGTFKSKGDYSESDLKREETPKLMLGATYDYHDRAVREHGNTKSFMYNDAGYFETNIYTLFADMIFKYKGLSVMGEYANKTADQVLATNTDGTLTGDAVNAGQGFNAQAGYLFKKNFEFAGRYTLIMYDKQLGKNDITMYTLGFSRYIVGHKLKVQSDVSLTQQKGKDDNIMYRLQLDVHF
ncbi:MAG: hypothetical protein Kow0079_03930 [Vicingaceae bacterium]